MISAGGTLWRAFLPGISWSRSVSGVQNANVSGESFPALARQLAKFREPIGKGLVLPPRDVFLKCSCHVLLLATQ